MAAKYGKIEVANLLLQKNASPDASGKVGWKKPLPLAQQYLNARNSLIISFYLLTLTLVSTAWV